MRSSSLPHNDSVPLWRVVVFKVKWDEINGSGVHRVPIPLPLVHSFIQIICIIYDDGIVGLGKVVRVFPFRQLISIINSRSDVHSPRPEI